MHRLIIPATIAVFALTLYVSARFTGEASAPTTLNGLATAGKVLFEETAGELGCASCHGMDARGEGTAPDIRRADAALIVESLRDTADMRNMGLTERNVREIAAYLAYVRKKQGI